jgi:hypothetical protein
MLQRSRIGRRLKCPFDWPDPLSDREGPPPGAHEADLADFAVDHNQVYYADDHGVFQVDPSRLHWNPDC